MTKQELITRQQVWKRKAGLESAGWVVIVFALLAGFVQLKNHVEARFHASWVDPVFAISFFVILGGNLLFVVWFGKRQFKRYGVACPHCGGPLAGRSGEVVVATGNCGRCGERILDDKPAA
jgi:DNA-directed RNA polymerase subunit RPC12/RpoP